jgi:O-antigen ligase
MPTVAGFGGLSAAAPGALVGRPRERRAAAEFPAAAERPETPWSFKLLLVFLLLLFANLPLLVPKLAALAPAQVVALAALALLVVERSVTRERFRLPWPESYLLAAFLVVATLSSFTALWPRHALDNTWMLAKFVAIYLLIVNTVDSWRRLRAACAVLAVGGLIPALGTLRNFRAGQLVEGDRAGWIGIFEGPNDVAYSLTMLFPLALALALGARGRWRLPLWAGLGLYAAAIFSTYSRSGLLGFAVVLALCLWRWSPRWARLPLLAVGAVGFAIVVTSYWGRDEGFADLLADATMNQRLATIEAGLEMFADYPLVGVGLGCSALGWPIYAPPGAISQDWLHSHNTFIQLLSETGLLGAAAFLLVVGLGLGTAIRVARRLALAGRGDLARTVAALEISLWGFLACGLAGGWVLTWFPYLVLGLVAAARLLPVPAAPDEDEAEAAAGIESRAGLAEAAR